MTELAQFSAMKDDQSILLPLPGGVQVVHVVASRAQPLSLQQASPAIEQFLRNERKRQVIADDVNWRCAPAAKIEYVGAFSKSSGNGGPAEAVTTPSPPRSSTRPTLPPAHVGIAPPQSTGSMPSAAPQVEVEAAIEHRHRPRHADARHDSRKRPERLSSERRLRNARPGSWFGPVPSRISVPTSCASPVFVSFAFSLLAFGITAGAAFAQSSPSATAACSGRTGVWAAARRRCSGSVTWSSISVYQNPDLAVDSGRHLRDPTRSTFRWSATVTIGGLTVLGRRRRTHRPKLLREGGFVLQAAGDRSRSAQDPQQRDLDPRPSRQSARSLSRLTTVGNPRLRDDRRGGRGGGRIGSDVVTLVGTRNGQVRSSSTSIMPAILQIRQVRASISAVEPTVTSSMSTAAPTASTSTARCSTSRPVPARARHDA